MIIQKDCFVKRKKIIFFQNNTGKCCLQIIFILGMLPEQSGNGDGTGEMVKSKTENVSTDTLDLHSIYCLNLS